MKMLSGWRHTLHARRRMLQTRWRAVLLAGWRTIALVTVNVVLIIVSTVALTYDAYRYARDRYDARQPVAARALEYRVYEDDANRLSVAIPVGFESVAPPSGAPKSAHTWASSDGQGRITTWALSSRTKSDLTPDKVLASCQQKTVDAGGKVTFTYASDRFYVCGGKDTHGLTFYERGVIGQNRSYYFRWEYANRWRKVYEPAVQQAVETFTPGPLLVIAE